MRSDRARGPYETLELAIKAVADYGNQPKLYRILRGDMSASCEKFAWEGYPLDAQKGAQMGDLLDQNVEPLNLDREAVVTALQAKADEEKAKREAEQAKLDEARKEAIDAIALFTPQELYEIFRINFTVDADDLQRYHAEEKYVPKPVAVGKTETDVERAIRVLGMSSEKTVPVKVGTDLYGLL